MVLGFFFFKLTALTKAGERKSGLKNLEKVLLAATYWTLNNICYFMITISSLKSIHLNHWKLIWYSHTFKEGSLSFSGRAGLNPSLFPEKKSKTKKGQIKYYGFVNNLKVQQDHNGTNMPSRNQ